MQADWCLPLSTATRKADELEGFRRTPLPDFDALLAGTLSSGSSSAYGIPTRSSPSRLGPFLPPLSDPTASRCIDSLPEPPRSAAQYSPTPPARNAAHQHSLSWSATVDGNRRALQSPFQAIEDVSPGGSLNESPFAFPNYSLQPASQPTIPSALSPAEAAPRKVPVSMNQHFSSSTSPTESKPAVSRDASSSPFSKAHFQSDSYVAPSYSAAPFFPRPAGIMSTTFQDSSGSRQPSSIIRNSASMMSELMTDGKGDAAIEKKRKRRESHNLVERRRRDGINIAIQQLAELLPDQMLDPTNAAQGTHTHHKSSSGHSLVSMMAGSDSGLDNGLLSALKPNKSVVLQKSVEYMQYLKQMIAHSQARNNELEILIKQMGGHSLTNPSQAAYTHAAETQSLFD